MSVQGLSSTTQARLILDAGALYRDYGEATEQLIGATRGGAVFEVNRADRQVEMDGGWAEPSGLVRTVRHEAVLRVSVLEVSQQTLLDLTRGTVASNGTHRVFTPSNQLTAAHYYTNISLVAEVAGTGDPIVLKLLNVLPAGGWRMTTDHRREAAMDVVFSAHYDITAVDDAPYEVMLPLSAAYAPAMLASYAGVGNFNQTVGTAVASDLAAQEFTVAAARELTHVVFTVKNFTWTGGTAHAEIRAVDGSGFPTGLALASSESIDGNDIGLTYEPYAFQFTGANRIELTPGNYAACVRGGSWDLRLHVHRDSTAVGQGQASLDGASLPGAFLFEVWGQ